MATLLNDQQIRRLIGKVIINGDESCIRPNSYILRLGSSGEFLNTGKEFNIGTKKKGIRLPPGHSVALTAYETLDFRRDIVHDLFPGHDLHGVLSPTTDLSREGIVAPSTQVDAGYHGTLNWTLTNTSSEERRFLYKEHLFRLSIFELEEGETPENLYSGDYQSQIGYVRSKRRGAPVGMKETEWEDAYIKGGPEDLLDNLISTGYPWHILGKRLKLIDQQFKVVSEEYSEIYTSIGKLTSDINQIRERQTNTSGEVRRVLREEADSLQNRWLIGAGTLITGALGLVLAVISNQSCFQLIKQYGHIIGSLLILSASVVMFLIFRKRK